MYEGESFPLEFGDKRETSHSRRDENVNASFGIRCFAVVHMII